MTARKRQWLPACALCAITLLAFANSFASGFIHDSHILVVEDTRVHQATAENIARIVNHTYWWPFMESGLYRPVTTLSFLFNYAILGNADRPAGYHWINLLLHAGNVLLVFALARRLVGDFGQSFLIAAVWAVHPVLTESVTNIVGRSDLLAGMTSLGGLSIYLRSAEASGGRRWAWLAGLTAVTAVGVFSKESAVALLGMIWLYELTWWNSRGSVRKQLRGLLLGCVAIFPAFLALWWMRSRVLAASAPALFPFVNNPIVAADFWTGRLTAVKVMAKYLGLLVWPAKLSWDYSYPQIPLADGRPTDWMAWIVVAATAVVVASLYRRNKTVFFAAGFSFVAILPASNLLVPVGTIMAERLLYLPAVGLSICLAQALYALGRRVGVRALAPALLSLIVIGFGARTWVRNRDWRTDFTLSSAGVRTSPLSYNTHLALAVAMHAEHFDYNRILGEDERGIALLDSLPDRLNSPATYVNVGGQYIDIGNSLLQHYPDGRLLVPRESLSKYQRAETLLRRSLAMTEAQRTAGSRQGLFWGESGDPRLTSANSEINAHLGLTDINGRLGRTDEALQQAREAQAAGPGHAAVYQRLHDALLAAGRTAEARDALLEGVLLTSDPVLMRMLAAGYAAGPGEDECAISYARGAPEIDASCGIIRRQVCAVAGEVVRLGLKADGPDLASRLKNELAAKYGCP